MLHYQPKINLDTGAITGAYEYLHIAIDDHSRISFAAILPDQSNRSAIRFFIMARAHFNRFGITIRRVYSDNGSCYRHWLYRKLMN